MGGMARLSVAEIGQGGSKDDQIIFVVRRRLVARAESQDGRVGFPALPSDRARRVEDNHADVGLVRARIQRGEAVGEECEGTFRQ